jgi:hypothetical protein
VPAFKKRKAGQRRREREEKKTGRRKEKEASNTGERQTNAGNGGLKKGIASRPGKLSFIPSFCMHSELHLLLFK